ncbi:MAG: hypothetical protein J2P48_08360 [Alphaproteobacteria bacterium]|nr:hypothetical protein [Alphaproteobacteria bacterium]
MAFLRLHNVRWVMGKPKCGSQFLVNVDHIQAIEMRGIDDHHAPTSVILIAGEGRRDVYEPFNEIEAALLAWCALLNPQTLEPQKPEDCDEED